MGRILNLLDNLQTQHYAIILSNKVRILGLFILSLGLLKPFLHHSPLAVPMTCFQ